MGIVSAAHLHAVGSVAPATSASDMTDLSNARRLIAIHGHHFRWVGPWGVWLTWDGRRWTTDRSGQIVESAKQVARQLLDDAVAIGDAEQRRKAVAAALGVQSANRVEAMIRMARTEPGIPVEPEELDRDPWLLNVANGILELRTGRLVSHDPRRLITKLADVDFEPDAEASRWRGFLEQILPDVELREFAARWFGHCLTGDVSEHKIVFGVGAGANGKTTLLNALATMLGDYATQAAPDLLMRRRDDPHPTGLADLHGARLVLATETAQGRQLDEALVKRLTGGDRVRARKMHKDFFEFDPTHKLVVATNHRPTVEGTDHGIWRRIRLLPFTIVIPDEDQDHHLDEKLRAEASGILRWAVEGCRRWQGQGLTEPTAVIAATADYRAEMDVLGEFISDRCFLADVVSARAADLYDTYTAWAETMGERALSQRRFGTNLRERGLEKRRSNGIWWAGIGIRATERSTDHDEGAGQQGMPQTVESTELGFGK